MRRPLIRPPLVALILGFALAAASAVLPPAAAPVAPAALRPLLARLEAPVAEAADGIAIRTATRYVVDPKDEVVRVSVVITATNDKPDRDAGGAVTRYFYDGVNLGVQPEARNLRATQDGQGVGVTATDRPGFRLVGVRFRTGIFRGQTAKVRLQYDLPAGKPRSASDVRVGAAFASFLAWAFGDQGTVRVDVPAAFEVDVTGEEMTKSTGDGGAQVFRATVDNPLAWFAGVNARNDDGLTRTRVTLAGGDEVVVRAWPEDSRWRRRVSTTLGEAIPDLTRRIGLPWPVDGPLSVLEIHTPLLEGYAGFYDPSSDQITISEDLDDVTIVHEASHAWFNQGLFSERWINEGLAETYAGEVVQAIGGTPAAPASVAATDPVAFPLEDWPPPAAINDDTANAREVYGYAAARTVIAAVLSSAREAGMQRVFAAAEAGTTAYVGSGAAERSTLTTNDWRRFLDLTETLGGATGVGDLLATWALTPADARQLPVRAAARSAYDGLAIAGDTWAPPLAVRMAMDGWRFDVATAEVAEASSILARRDSIASLAAKEGVTPPTGLEGAYEAARTADELAGVANEAMSSQASLMAVAAADAALAAPRDWLTAIGLQGKDPDRDLAAARAAWEAGSPDQAKGLAATATGTLAVAPEAGRGRALVVGGVVGLVLLLLVAVLLARRGSRRRRAVARARMLAPALTPTMAAPPPGSMDPHASTMDPQARTWDPQPPVPATPEELDPASSPAVADVGIAPPRDAPPES